MGLIEASFAFFQPLKILAKGTIYGNIIPLSQVIYNQQKQKKNLKPFVQGY